MRIGIANASTLLSDADTLTMTAAIDAQLREDFCSLWRRSGAEGAVWLPGGIAAVGAPDLLLLQLVDTVAVPGALGYHDELPDGTIYGKVAVKPVLDAGGGVLTAGGSGDSVSAVLSHEALEAKLDPNVNLWADGPVAFEGVAYASVAYESSDPVQAGAYSSHGVLLSNFVGPSYFDRQNLRGGSKGPARYDWMGQLTAPLSVAPGGYLIVRQGPGSESQVFGEGGNGRPWRAGGRRFLRSAKAA